MLTKKQIQDVVKRQEELTTTMKRLIHEQYKGAGYGTSQMDTQEFMGWIAINMRYHSEDEVVDVDGTVTGTPGATYRVPSGDLTRFFAALANSEGGMAEIDRFERITRTGRYAGDGA